MIVQTLQSAVLRLHVVRQTPSVRDVGVSGPATLEILETNSPTPLLFVDQRSSTYSQSQGNMGKFWGDYGVVGKKWRGNSSRGRTQYCRSFSGHPYYMVHRAVIFAVAQLSYYFVIKPAMSFKYPVSVESKRIAISFCPSLCPVSAANLFLYGQSARV